MTRQPSTKSRTEPDHGRRGPDRPLATAPPTVAAVPKRRRLARQHLAGVVEERVQFGDGRSRARRHDELGRVAADDAPMAARIEFLARPPRGRGTALLSPPRMRSGVRLASER